MTAGDAIERDSDVQQTRHRVTAVHDKLRQAIAGEIAAWRGYPADWEDFLDVADRALAVMWADPTVARRFAIAETKYEVVKLLIGELKAATASTIDSQHAQEPLEAPQTAESTPTAQISQKGTQ